jgi:RNA-directed DNA polymerase
MREAEPEKKNEISEADQRGQGRKPEATQASGSNFPGRKEQTGPKPPDLIERMLERGNMLKALQAVEANRGAAGVDGMEVKQLRDYLREHWAEIRERILSGNYEPRPVRRVDIPKPGGGTRMLGIPTVLDRLIQQAIHQILSPLWEEGFSAHSYGFRPGRSAAQAVKAAQAHIQSGKRWIVDVDLEKFLDRSSYYTSGHGVDGKSCGCWSNACIRRPFCRPRDTWTTESSPRFTRCMIVCRDTPRMRIASGMAT